MRWTVLSTFFYNNFIKITVLPLNWWEALWYNSHNAVVLL